MPKFKFKLNPFKRKPKITDFLVIEIGLEQISTAVFAKEEHSKKLKAISNKSFTKQEEVFDSVLESLDELAAQIVDFPQKGILGISGGSLETVTTIAKYQRQKKKKAINPKETEDILHNVAEGLDGKEKKIFFSTVANAKVDNVKVSNPLGLKGENVELSCFVAFKNTQEMDLLDRLMEEIDLKIEKIVPSSFAVAHFMEGKKWEDVLLLRIGENKSEITSLVSGHISEILPVGLGTNEEEFLHLSWQNAISKLEKTNHPKFIWVYPDNEKADLEKAVGILEAFDWKEKLKFEVAPKIELAEDFEDFPVNQLVVQALAKEDI